MNAYDISFIREITTSLKSMINQVKRHRICWQCQMQLRWEGL